MKFIDTHSHLYSSQFDADRNQVVKNALAAGVETILLPNISSKYTKKMLDLCHLFPKNCFPMMGLHPCDVTKNNYDAEILHVETELEKGKYLAVGEIGIDLYWDKTNLDIQKKTFEYQIKLAKKYKLPVVIHIRESFNEAFDIILKHNDNDLIGVFHCFTGSLKDANKIINLGGFYLGIGGVLTFKNSDLSETIKNVPLEYLILETDSPYLSPTPFRGKRNESKYIVNIAEKLAETCNKSLEEIAKITTQNAKNLFQL